MLNKNEIQKTRKRRARFEQKNARERRQSKPHAFAAFHQPLKDYLYGNDIPIEAAKLIHLVIDHTLRNQFKHMYGTYWWWKLPPNPELMKVLTISSLKKITTAIKRLMDDGILLMVGPKNDRWVAFNPEVFGIDKKDIPRVEYRREGLPDAYRINLRKGDMWVGTKAEAEKRKSKQIKSTKAPSVKGSNVVAAKHKRRVDRIMEYRDIDDVFCRTPIFALVLTVITI